MSPNAIVSKEGNLRDLSKTDMSTVESREPLDANAMAEMMYQNFEQGVDELAQRGVSLPPPTDMNGRLLPGYEQYMTKVASGDTRGHMHSGQSRPISSSEQAIATLMDVREDMLRKYASMTQDPVTASTIAMSIQKIETQIISMGGDVERFDPAKYRSGLRPVAQTQDPMDQANKVVANTRQVYAEYPIKEIYAGRNKGGKPGICIKLACSSNGKPVTVHGTVVPKTVFSGTEAIDFVIDGTQGRMTVKNPNRGVWEDVSGDYDIAWQTLSDG